MVSEERHAAKSLISLAFVGRGLELILPKYLIFQAIN